MPARRADFWVCEGGRRGAGRKEKRRDRHPQKLGGRSRKKKKEVGKPTEPITGGGVARAQKTTKRKPFPTEGSLTKGRGSAND